METDNSFRNVGFFTITEAEKNPYGMIKCVAYDNCYKLTDYIIDDLVTGYVEEEDYPDDMGEFYDDIISTCGLTSNHGPTYNDSMPYNRNLTVNQATARDILSYIAQADGGYIYADAVGRVNVGHFQTNYEVVFDSDCKYGGEILNDTYISEVNCVWLGADENDVGVQYPSYVSANNAKLRITYNPMFYFHQYTEGATAPTNPAYLHVWKNTTNSKYYQWKAVPPQTTRQWNEIPENQSTWEYNVLTFIITLYFRMAALGDYYPLTLNMFSDKDISMGSGLSVYDKRGIEHRSYVFQKKWNADGVTITATGNSDRMQSTSSQSKIESLSGKYNTLKRTINETKSQVGDLSGEVSTISQTVDAIDTEVTDARGTSSTLKQRIDSIESTVTRGTKTYKQNSAPSDARDGDLWYYTGTTTAQYTNGTWYRYNGSSWESTKDPQVTTNTSTISQQANQIALVVKQEQGQDVVNGASIIAGINSDGSQVKISANKVEIEGNFVTFTDLATSGSTVINGANITTGKINTNYIDAGSFTMTGGSINIETDQQSSDLIHLKYGNYETKMEPEGIETNHQIVARYLTAMGPDEFDPSTLYEVSIGDGNITADRTIECTTILPNYCGSTSSPVDVVHTKNVSIKTATTVSNRDIGFNTQTGITGYYVQKYSASSRRFKHNIHELTPEMREQFRGLYNIEVKNWTYNNDHLDPNDELYGKETYGLIAEDVGEIIPGAVTHEDGLIRDYDDRRVMNAMLVLLQEQKQKIDELESRLEALENEQNE